MHPFFFITICIAWGEISLAEHATSFATITSTKEEAPSASADSVSGTLYSPRGIKIAKILRTNSAARGSRGALRSLSRTAYNTPFVRLTTEVTAISPPPIRIPFLSTSFFELPEAVVLPSLSPFSGTKVSTAALPSIVVEPGSTNKGYTSLGIGGATHSPGGELPISSATNSNPSLNETGQTSTIAFLQTGFQPLGARLASANGNLSGSNNTSNPMRNPQQEVASVRTQVGYNLQVVPNAQANALADFSARHSINVQGLPPQRVQALLSAGARLESLGANLQGYPPDQLRYLLTRADQLMSRGIDLTANPYPMGSYLSNMDSAGWATRNAQTASYLAAFGRYDLTRMSATELQGQMAAMELLRRSNIPFMNATTEDVRAYLAGAQRLIEQGYNPQGPVPLNRNGEPLTLNEVIGLEIRNTTSDLLNSPSPSPSPSSSPRATGNT